MWLIKGARTTTIKTSGISCIIAEDFARIFYRNAINIGLPIIESPQAVKSMDDGDVVEVDFDNGEIKNITKNLTFKIEPFPAFIQSIISAGGLVSAVEKGLLGERK